MPRPRLRAGVVAASLLRAGVAALDAGAVDAGVETLRRAAAEAGRAADPGIQAEVQRALGSALVHAVRGSDGEGAVGLHYALLAARRANRPALVADILRELAFVDVQAGRHASADRFLREASPHASGDPALLAGILAWALVYQAESGDYAKIPLARSAAGGIANPVLQARVQALPAGEPYRCITCTSR